MNSDSLTLDFDAEGVGHCLYGEAIDLQSLGSLTVRRASHIEFNPTTQQWEVLPPDGGKPLFNHPSRSQCETWEHNNLHPITGETP